MEFSQSCLLKVYTVFAYSAYFVFSLPQAKITTEPGLLSASVSWSQDDGYQIHSGLITTSNIVAQANFTNAINHTGWANLEVRTESQFPDHVQAYAAGMLEGFLTEEILYWHWKNTVEGYCQGRKDLCDSVKQFFGTNMHWVQNMLAKHAKSDPYWHQVGLFYDQLFGLEEGWRKAAEPKGHFIGKYGIIWMNIFGDLEDLEMLFENKTKSSLRTQWDHVLGSGSCSALIKVLPGNKDLFVAQDSWNSFQSMLRILKKYSFGFHLTDQSSKVIPGHTMSFSSYPGILFSGDDFSLISSGLATLETTIGNGNATLLKHVKPVGQVLEGVRCTVANRLATTGKTWAKVFTMYNSGTYNNQWMIVDYKKFKPGNKLPDDVLWVLEQVPGYIVSEDVTDVLRKQSYWPSYNSPYFKFIFNISGNVEKVEKYGDWFSYDKTPRALIFKRDHSKVVDVQSMIKLMRYNDFKHDPLSRCNCTPPYSAENAISSRNDLNPKNGTYPFGALGHRSHGGIDMKLTTSSLFSHLNFIAFGGPTYDDLPPFQWSLSDFANDTPHNGQPDLWKFKPYQTQWH